MKLFWKIYFTVFVSFAAAVFVISYVSLVRQISDAEQHIIQEKRIIADFVSKELEVRYSESEWPFESLHKLVEQNDFLFWWVVREDGTIHLADTSSLMRTSVYSHFPRLTGMKWENEAFLSEKDHCGIFIEPLEMGKERWSFWLGFSTKEISETKKHLILLDVVVSVSALAVLGILLYFAIKHFTEPIKDLTEGTAIIGDGDLSHRVKRVSQDELGQLALSFNKMAERLEDTTVSKELLEDAWQKLRDTQAQLIQSAKLASIGELAAGVAHELNQPLMVIRGTAQLLQRSLKKGGLQMDELMEHLEPIERNTKRMMNIIDHLRSFSRQSPAHFSPVDVNEAIEACFLMVGEQLRVCGIEVIKNLAPSPLKVSANAHQVEQVLLNLITNARDAIEHRRVEEHQPGGSEEPGRVEILTRMSEDDQGALEILLKDNGKGIPSGVRDRIFEPFFTTKEVGKGTGLGLSISYGIIKNHQGEIDVAETGPHGTTFRIRLPLVDSGTQDSDSLVGVSNG